MHTAPRPAIGLLQGLAAVFRGFAFVATTPATWAAALVPTLLLLLLAPGFAWLAATTGFEPLDAQLPAAESAVGRAGVEAVRWATRAALALLGVLVAFAVVPPLSAPALEHIVGLQEEALGMEKRPPIGLVTEMWCGLRAQAAAIAWAAPLLGVLWVASLTIPGAVVVTTPLKLVVTGLAIAWNLLDYPLTLRAVSIRRRLELVRRNIGAAAGFGLGFAAVFAVPCAAVVALPAGAAGAARLSTAMLRGSGAVEAHPA